MRKLKILLVYDVPYEPQNGADALTYMVGDEWRDERDVLRTLTRLGHDVAPFGIYDDIQPLVDAVRRRKPDVIFNQCESFRADRAHEPNLPALLELLGVPYTGAGPEALALCKDKGMTKKLLAFHDVRVPRFTVSLRHRPGHRGLARFAYPGICKPLGLDASEGIAQSSLVTNATDCEARLRFIHGKLGTDAIVEEYIDGRELYVGVFGNDRLTVLPPQELFFTRLPPGAPRVLTFKAKWDMRYRRRYGIGSASARPMPPRTLARLNDMCKTVYRLCKITGYARLDLRLTPDADDVVFIEVNPNPSIKRTDDFAGSAKQAGLGYGALLSRLVNLALAS